MLTVPVHHQVVGADLAVLDENQLRLAAFGNFQRLVVVVVLWGRWWWPNIGLGRN